MAPKKADPDDSALGEWLAATMLVASFILLVISSAFMH